MSDAIKQKLHRILANHLQFVADGEPIPPDTDLRDLGLDSAGAIDLLLDLEQTFSVTLPESLVSAETFRTATTLEDALRRLTSASSGGEVRK